MDTPPIIPPIPEDGIVNPQGHTPMGGSPTNNPTQQGHPNFNPDGHTILNPNVEEVGIFVNPFQGHEVWTPEDPNAPWNTPIILDPNIRNPYDPWKPNPDPPPPITNPPWQDGTPRIYDPENPPYRSPQPFHETTKSYTPKICCVGFDPERSICTAIVQVPQLLPQINNFPCDEGLKLRVGFWFDTVPVTQQSPICFQGEADIRIFSYGRTSLNEDIQYAFELSVSMYALPPILLCQNDPQFILTCVTKISGTRFSPFERDITKIPIAEMPSIMSAPIQYPKISKFGKWDVDTLKTTSFPQFVVTLPSGKVFFFSSGSSFSIFDPQNRTTQLIPSPPQINGKKLDIEGCGISILPDGRIVLFGGPFQTHKGVTTGSKIAVAYNPQSGQWHFLQSMNIEISNPATLTLGNGRIFIMGGKTIGDWNLLGANTDLEIYDPVSNHYDFQPNVNPNTKDEARNIPIGIYDRLHLLPDGTIFCSALGTLPSSGERVQLLGIPQQKWIALLTNNNNFPINIDSHEVSILLPFRSPFYQPFGFALSGRKSLLFQISNTNSFFGQRKKKLDVSEIPGRLPKNRIYGQGILLPDGTVLVAGGIETDDFNFLPDVKGVRDVEIFDPTAKSWSIAQPMKSVRGKDSIGVLLQDGRVLFAGSRRNGKDGVSNQDMTIEIYTPDYLWRGPRPIFTVSKSIIRYGEIFTITLGSEFSARFAAYYFPNQGALGAGPASYIRLISLLRCCAATSSHIIDQRFVELEVDSYNNVMRIITVRLPGNFNLIPPGNYWIFLTSRAGCPSEGFPIQVKA